MKNTMTKRWWHNSVVYQIYPRSFMDSNGDGVGDLRGIINKLDYLQELGIDAIWLSPAYKSPQDDNGYDISDYYDIHEEYGTLAEMEEFIEEAKKRNIKIVMDIVANHTSDEHAWFIEAKKGPDSPYYDYYIWRDGVDGEVPNGLGSTFSGTAWEWCEEVGKYYLHLFSKRQPDLNWENENLRKDIYKMINWWSDKGIGGFRLDVIDLIGKIPDEMVTGNGPKLHEYIQEMSRETFQKYDVLTVGETWGATPEIAKQYSNPDGSELSMIFQFEHIGLDEQPGGCKWNLAPLNYMKLKEVFKKWQLELEGKGWNSLFWNNHDLPRIVSRWGNDKEYRKESAKMLATLLHVLKGTPYIYQGEEIGMTNVRFENLEDYRDIELLNMYAERKEQGDSHESIMASIYAKGRDNARTPMQWNAEANGGFTIGEPWIKVNPNYKEVNVEDNLKDKNSIFYHYQALIALRKSEMWSETIVYGDFEMLYEDHADLFAYKRMSEGKELVVLCNFHNTACEMANEFMDYELILSNYDYSGQVETLKLRPYEAIILSKSIK